MNTDTVNLLKECNKGSKMAVNSLDELLDKTQDESLYHMLLECKERHCKLGDELHVLLNEYGETQEEVKPVAKAMSWVMTNIKMATEPDDKTIANIMTDGCNMGIKSLYKYLNEYEDANDKARTICMKIIGVEENFLSNICTYL